MAIPRHLTRVSVRALASVVFRPPATPQVSTLSRHSTSPCTGSRHPNKARVPRPRFYSAQPPRTTEPTSYTFEDVRSHLYLPSPQPCDVSLPLTPTTFAIASPSQQDALQNPSYHRCPRTQRVRGWIHPLSDKHPDWLLARRMVPPRRRVRGPLWSHEAQERHGGDLLLQGGGA